MLKVLGTTLFAAFAVSAFAQDAAPATLNIAESETYGPYLVDAAGSSLYLFVDEDMAADGPERMTDGVRANAVSCTDRCLDAWPPFAEAAVAGEGVDPELLYSAEFDGMTMVVYNGWPLYYYARDEAPGDTNGQDVGREPNIWYLVSPDGNIIEEGAEGGEGESGGSGG